MVFSIYDGIVPSNEGRGYIVRKIVRKSVLHLRNLGINKPFLNRLVGQLAQIMYKPYPDLKSRQEDIAKVILNEETGCINTLSQSGSLWDKAIEEVRYLLNEDPKIDNFIIPSISTSAALGTIAFKLYDTNGIPVEVSKEELAKRQIKPRENFDLVFVDELKKQQDLSKSSSKMKGDVFDAKGLNLKLDPTKFVGYEKEAIEVKVLVILKDGKELDTAQAGESLEVILDQTPFYAESGGQVGDTGQLINGQNIFEVTDTQKIDNIILHIGKVKAGVFKPNDQVTAQINVERRQNIARNHTATHILQAVLRQVLGGHVQQQGSLVTAEKFRFDFTHPKGLTKEEIVRIEETANRYINNDYAVGCRQMSFDEAKKSGALAFFEEKYGECVRVVSVGDVSKELCGGTHLSSIGEINLIKITAESSVASGIRRIEGVTAGFARQFIDEQKQKALEAAQRSEQLKALKEQEKKRSLEINKMLPSKSLELVGKCLTVNGIKAVFAMENDFDLNALRSLTDMVKEKIGSGVVVLGSGADGKASLVVGLTQDLVAQGLSAKEMIQQIASLIGGSGGGRPDFAQAGGSKPENFMLAFDKLRDIIKISS